MRAVLLKFVKLPFAIAAAVRVEAVRLLKRVYVETFATFVQVRSISDALIGVDRRDAGASGASGQVLFVEIAEKAEPPEMLNAFTQ